MQNIESPLTETAVAAAEPASAVVANADKSFSSNYNVVRRNGKLTSFDKDKIAIAMTKAFLAVEGGQAAASGRVHETVEQLTNLVVKTLLAIDESSTRQRLAQRLVDLEDKTQWRGDEQQRKEALTCIRSVAEILQIP